MAHEWTSIGNLPPIQGGNVAFVPDTMLLLTDGAVLVHQRMNEHLPTPTGMEWFRLTPDGHGSYAAGTWSGPFSMQYARQYFASGVLRDGRVFVVGGEYSTASPLDSNGNAVDTATGEVFDPVTNTWSTLDKPAAFDGVRRDAAACVLSDGRVLFGAAWSNFTALWNPVTGEWREAGTAFGARPTNRVGNADEQTWTLLPDGTVLTANIDKAVGGNNVSAVPGSEKYLPDTDEWISAGDTPSDLSFRNGYVDPATGFSVTEFEIGPSLVLPDGKLFALGATGHTAIYTPPAHPAHRGTWSAGPDLPNDANGHIQLADDMPAVLLPCGLVLLLGGPANVTYTQDANGHKTGIASFWIQPLTAFLYDPATNAAPLPLAPPLPTTSGNGRLLLLPTGEVLYACEQANVLAMLTLDPSLLPAPRAHWKPAITRCPSHMTPGHTYDLSGKQLNGLSQACSYGDDAQMATNYPIVRLTGPTGQVVYLRSFDFSTLGVATGDRVVDARVHVPPAVAPGRYALQAIANGIASAPFEVHVG